jgi:opine dehydrogenase
MVHEIEKEHQLSNIVCFAIGLIPWICRTISYGSKAANYGGKQVNIVAVTPSVKFAKLNELLLDDICYNPLGTGKFLLACSFLSLTLSVDNQIIHPGRCYGLFRKCGGRWPSLDSVPYFYRDFDDVSAEHIKRLDDDYSVIRTAVRLHFPKRKFKYMLSYLDQLNLTHDSDVVDIKASFKDSEQLGLIKTPTVEQGKPDTETEVGQKSTVRVLDTSCRFFTDDIPYGLLIGKWIAEQLEVATPFIDEVIRWAQNLRNEHWLDADGKIDMSYCLSHQSFSGIPPSYGITSVDAILD